MPQSQQTKLPYLHSSFFALAISTYIIIIGSASAFVSILSRQLPLSSTRRHVERIQHHDGGGGMDDIALSSSSTPSAYSTVDERARDTHYQLTILIPAYNERNRVGSTLITYMNYLRKTPVYQHQASSRKHANLVSGSVAVLVVDDGSSDGTAEFIRGRSWISENYECENIMQLNNNYWRVDPNVNVITLSKNCGKGAAIARGMMELAPTSSFDQGLLCTKEDGSQFEKTVASLVLVADADGSGDISCVNGMLQCWEEMLSNSESSTRWADPRLGDQQRPALVVGYRRNLAPKSPLRALLSKGFQASVSLLFVGCGLGVRDTQCGFKLMTASAGKILYDKLNLRRWSHDVEVIHRARRLNVPVGECGVVWVDKDGSKLIEKTSDAIFASLAMFGEIAYMRLQYALGSWTVTQNGVHSRSHRKNGS